MVECTIDVLTTIQHLEASLKTIECEIRIFDTQYDTTATDMT